MAKKIGILTAGSDSPGLNAAIRSIGKSAASAGIGLIGFQDGFLGLIQDLTVPLEESMFSGILTSGGTILGTSRDQPHDISSSSEEDRLDAAVQNFRKHKLDGIICLGGRETQMTAYRLMNKGINVLSLPKAIDNDVAFTDTTVGFDTAVTIAAEAIDRLHNTAHSHHRIIIVEIVGQYAGWLTLGSGIAGGADVILIPEIPYDVNKIAEAILRRSHAGKRFSIVAVAEGAIPQEYVNFFDRSRRVNAMQHSGEERQQVDIQLNEIEKRFRSSTHLLADRLEQFTGLETRTTILGYLLRGGAPNSTDRLLATQLGTRTAELVRQGKYGSMVAVHHNETVAVPLADVAGKHRLVPMDHPWIESARQVGTNMGD